MTMPQGTSAETSALIDRIDALASKDEIRDCLYRINRGMDRSSEAMLRSGFHADAEISWGSLDPKPIEAWLVAARAVQANVVRIHHLIGNIVIKLDGEEASVESYEIGLITARHGGLKDLIMGCRYVDKFERRDGEWRIARRTKITDWTRSQEAVEPLWPEGSICATRDERDASVEALGELDLLRNA